MASMLEGTGWKTVWVDIPIHNDSTLDRMNTKELRTCPHRFPILQEYEYLCWFDNKLKVDSEKINALVTELQTSSNCIVLNKHPYQFSTVWGEYEEANKHAHYAIHKDSYKAYIERKLASGISELLPVHYCGGFHIRKMTDPRAARFGEEWLKDILECGIEDQISLQFVHQRFSDCIVGIEYQACWTYNF